MCILYFFTAEWEWIRVFFPVCATYSTPLNGVSKINKTAGPLLKISAHIAIGQVREQKDHNHNSHQNNGDALSSP